MRQAKAIYAWWKKLPLWIRIPLSLVLLVALLALIVDRIVRTVWPREPDLFRPVVRARAERAERNAEKLNDAVEKADERYTEIKKELDHGTKALWDYEKAVGSANSIDAVDDLIAEQVGRNKKHQWGKPGDS